MFELDPSGKSFDLFGKLAAQASSQHVRVDIIEGGHFVVSSGSEGLHSKSSSRLQGAHCSLCRRCADRQGRIFSPPLFGPLNIWPVAVVLIVSSVPCLPVWRLGISRATLGQPPFFSAANADPTCKALRTPAWRRRPSNTSAKRS